MLRKFKVSNFKCFKGDFEFDLSTAKNYTFNPECVKGGIVNNAMIYGYNGCGKSNLGWAVFDIIEHLTEKARLEFPYMHYTNAYNDSREAKFDYEFQIADSIVRYTYVKTDYKTIVSECLYINGNEVISFDRHNENTTFVSKLKGTETLNKTITDNKLSVVKYVKNNSELEDNGENNAFKGFFAFVEHMLFFRS